MKTLMKIILFLLVNAAGYFSVALVPNLAILLHLFPKFDPGQDVTTFQLWMGGGGMWVWIAMALVSLGYFFVRGSARTLLLLAPLFIPALYVAAVILYFSHAYQPV
jgi:hypothetical protein